MVAASIAGAVLGAGMVVYALGMSAKVAFPIMMASCAFLMPAASIRFVKSKAVDLKAAMGITIGGIVGVLIAAYVIVSIPLTALKWLVCIVLVYTAVSMLRDGLKGQSPLQKAERA